MNTSPWSHHSFTAPFTTTGRAALVKAPPWHYAGWLLNVAFRFDADAAAALVPPAGPTHRDGLRALCRLAGLYGWP
ncbi:MAG TPA: hypothetical protein VFY73_10325 [Ideonella sp.]|uniref:hypothetical protein n=1 Tax=Ideonella sp. TaxID=1929293 RepID=UPI002E348D58|nr:hypothetical protein [Ideonella sp.]HEX5684414.1 hypothetical protein [Ideonella sp.]